MLIILVIVVRFLLMLIILVISVRFLLMLIILVISVRFLLMLIIIVIIVRFLLMLIIIVIIVHFVLMLIVSVIIVHCQWRTSVTSSRRWELRHVREPRPATLSPTTTSAAVGGTSTGTTCSNAVSVSIMLSQSVSLFFYPPQWGAADAEIKVPSGENTDLIGSPFKAWSRSVYCHTSYAYCQGFLPCLFLPFWFIHLYFSKKNSPNFFLC